MSAHPSRQTLYNELPIQANVATTIKVCHHLMNLVRCIVNKYSRLHKGRRETYPSVRSQQSSLQSSTTYFNLSPKTSDWGCTSYIDKAALKCSHTYIQWVPILYGAVLSQWETSYNSEASKWRIFLAQNRDAQYFNKLLSSLSSFPSLPLLLHSQITSEFSLFQKTLQPVATDYQSCSSYWFSDCLHRCITDARQSYCLYKCNWQQDSGTHPWCLHWSSSYNYPRPSQ